MKTIKGLFLGSAAGLLAMGGAQAADLPVKAKPVEYVKICSLYGAGFYYMPGTDTCLKIGGYVRAEIGFGQLRGTGGTVIYGDTGLRTRSNDQEFMRGRANVNFDTRQQTEYGLLRTYINLDVLMSTNNPGAPGQPASGSTLNPNVTANSISTLAYAYIQFAGFTVGKAVSAIQIPWYTTGTVNANIFGINDASGAQTGVITAYYTAALGNGLSVTAGIADSTYSHMTLVDSSLAFGSPWASPSVGTGATSGQYVPDFVANIYLDQAWGSLFGGAIVHNLTASYFNGANFGTGASTANSYLNGHPADAWAFGVVGGILIKNIPTGVGDNVYINASYGDGMPVVSYGPLTSNGLIALRGYDNPQTVPGASQGGIGMGLVVDGVFGGPNRVGIQKTQSWGIMGAFEHYWVPGVWRTSLWGGYAQFHYNDTARSLLCPQLANSANVRYVNTDPGLCNPDVSVGQIGSRTSWFPVKNLQIDAEVSYTHTDQHLHGFVSVPTAASGNFPANATYGLRAQNVLHLEMRAQRAF